MKGNQCSYCKKKLLPKDLICFWDDAGDWHYCGGNWRPSHRSFWRWGRNNRRDDCCHNFANRHLFLCRPCYNSYQERKRKTIQQYKEHEKMSIIIATPILIGGFIFVLFWLIKRVQKKD